ncbi:MAG: hypothetical protein EA412_11490 [Chitinophagaceae bacterium]|nr:MAG: hypothetical protein EA412_11490 [Chitinophagaceae bacterium]
MNINKSFFIFFILFLSFHKLYPNQYSISINLPQQLLEENISKHAIFDVKELLFEACNCDINFNNETADIIIELPHIDLSLMAEPNRFSKKADFPFYHLPEHDYKWTLHQNENRIYLQLETISFSGISNGLYGLLQEKLGFAFIHARQTIIPDLSKWPLKTAFTWEAKARFDKRGFHLHTMHPIELAEPLLDHTFPGGLEMIKEYLEWLVRNNQNYFDFNLLESIDLDYWPQYAKEFVIYGQERGIIMGLDVSLHMIQQKAFKLYKNPPSSFRSRRNQIRRNLDKLFTAPWDYINMEFSTTEFSTGNQYRKEQLRLYIIDLLEEEYDAILTGREHVVKKDELISTGSTYTLTDEEKVTDAKRQTLVHTVMFYALEDESAPVYENENLSHMLDLMKKEMQVRETWFYPESAYWITFDNSVPMLLLPYLSGRLRDILLCHKLGVPGHITFSSGWEWGYWWIDWSIARWSWEHTFDEKIQDTHALQYINDVFQNDSIFTFFNKQLDLHESYLLEDELMRYMAAQTVTDEIPPPFNKEFHPRPRWRYKDLYRKSDSLTLDSLKTEGIIPLHEFGDASLIISAQYEKYFADDSIPLIRDLKKELYNAMVITALRAKHRAATLEYLSAKRRSNIDRDRDFDENKYLEVAGEIRSSAQHIVDETELLYRYPVELIARPYKGHTAYPYGYLYIPSKLHFWEREEEQIRRNRWGPLFMNIWDILMIGGLKN